MLIQLIIMKTFQTDTKTGETLERIKSKKGFKAFITVLDMGCGKGGDLRKYRIGKISHLICTDVAETSLDQAQDRYKEMQNFSSGGPNRFRGGNQRGSYGNHINRGDNNQQQNQGLFTAEFIHADSTRDRLRDRYREPKVPIDMVSIQFSFHYCFESLAQAERMIQNAAENLVPGGYLIGTTPDADDIIQRVRATGTNKYENDICSITFKPGVIDSESRIPIFGAEYDFHLDGVVDCPEFLVHFPVFIKIASHFGLKLVFKQRFADYYERMKDTKDGRFLLKKMTALESYPPFHGTPASPNPHDYNFAKEFIEDIKNSKDGSYNPNRNRIGASGPVVGTLSQSEWDVISLYVVFAFEKVDTDKHDDKKFKADYD